MRRWPLALALVAAVGLVGVSHANPLPLGADLRLWLRADDGAFTDLGTTPATDGATVRQWSDQLTGDNAVADDAIQGTAANRPLYVADGLNGRPVLRFDDTDALNGSTITLTAGTAPRTVFVVANNTGVTGDRGIFNLNRGPGGGPYVYKLTPEFAMRQGQGNRFWNTTLDATHAILAVQTPAPPENDTDHTVAYKDGPTPLGVASTANGTNPIDTGAAGIQGYQVVQGNYAGDVAEVLVYERYLSAAEINDVGYYLQQKYGIAGSFTTAATDVIWDGQGIDTDWSSPGNWDTSSEPAAAQNAFIGGGHTATLTKAGEVADVLTLGHNQATEPGIGTLNVNSGDLTVSKLTLGQGTDTERGLLTQNGGTITVNGDMTFEHVGGGQISRYVYNDGVLNVTGDVTQANGASRAHFYIDGDGANVHVGGDFTVQSFRTGDAAGSNGSYTLTGGQAINDTGT